MPFTVPVSWQFFDLSAPTVAMILVVVVATVLAIVGLGFNDSRFVPGPFGSGSRPAAEGESL